MTRNNNGKVQRAVALIAVFAIFAMPVSVLSQTQIKYHSNKYSVQDDVKLGRQAAAEVEQQLPVLRDSDVSNYVEAVGRRLVAAIPPQFQQREFQYYFRVVNASDINAFALPGGPMYINRGMIQAAKSEGEMAGVMAHELSHVALRHGTAQATKGQKYGLLAGILGVGGAILGGPAGAIIGQGGQFAVGAYFLKFSREYEREADILGAQIMARAGYDPRDLANMFRTIEQHGGGGGGFLSSHPSASDRYEIINREAGMLRVNNPVRDTRDFDRIQARLRGYPAAPSSAEIARSGQTTPAGNTGNASIGRVSAPSSRYRTYNQGVLQVNVPDNWRELSGGGSIWFAPEGAYGEYQGQSVFTHGVNLGVARTQNRDLQRATEEFVNNLAQTNPNLRRSTGYRRTTVSGRSGLTTTLRNTNEATRRAESVTLVTTQLQSGDLFYMIAVAPQNEARTFNPAFNNILRSIRLNG